MDATFIHHLPLLNGLPGTFPSEGALSMELVGGKPVIRASSSVQDRIETLLGQQRESGLSKIENEELDLYEEIDDYLSLLNRIVRNSFESEKRA